MGKFFGLIFAVALAVACQSSRAELLQTEGHIHLGTFGFSSTEGMVQLPSRMSGQLNQWYLADSFFGSFFNIGANAAAANIGTQYVSHGRGSSGPSATVSGFDLFFAANASEVNFNLSLYNGRNEANVPGNSANVASFDFGFTGLNPAGTFLYTATLLKIGPGDQFTLGQDFEYGLQYLSHVGGTGAFGPALQANQGLGFFGLGPAVLGDHVNGFEQWTAGRQDAGSRTGTFWFGATGPTAAARFGIHVVPEPSTVSLAAVACVGLLFRRRR